MKGLADEGFSPAVFHDKVGNEVGGNQGPGVVGQDPRERFMDHPDAAPEDFNRDVNLDG